MNPLPEPPAVGDQHLMRRGHLIALASGQASFRINPPSCSTCSSLCARSRVDEVVIRQTDVVSRVDLAPSSPVEACLYWSRNAMNRTVLALYGLPLSGLVAGVVAASGLGGDSSRGSSEMIPALLVLAGVVAGVMAGMIGGWLIVNASESRQPGDPSLPEMFIHSVDPGKKQ